MADQWAIVDKRITDLQSEAKQLRDAHHKALQQSQDEPEKKSHEELFKAKWLLLQQQLAKAMKEKNLSLKVQGHFDVYHINGLALLGEGYGSMLQAKLLVQLAGGSKHQVVGMFVVDSGCCGVELDIVLTKSKAKSIGLKPYQGPCGRPVVLQGIAADRTRMPLVKMWLQVDILVLLYQCGSGPITGLRKCNLTVWAADVCAHTLGSSNRAGSDSGVLALSAVEEAEEELFETAASSSSNSSVVDGEVLAYEDYDGTGYQAFHSPILDMKNIGLLGVSALAKLGLRADFDRGLVYGVELQMRMGGGIFKWIPEGCEA